MNKTVQFLKTKFSNYYATAPLTYPERFTRREWGFMFIGETFMLRHIAFRRSSELVNYLCGGQKLVERDKSSGFNKINPPLRIPSHVYYSSAYYAQPAAQPMPVKVEGWLGADLIFDLDDDHLRNVEELNYEQRLVKVKEIVKNKLLDDYILGDFGIDPKFIKIAFSGSRGYHIHVREPQVLKLSSAQRREIVDYLTGVGLNIDRIFPDEAFDTKEYGGKKFSKKKLVTPKLDSPGWKGRMARGIFELLNNLSRLPEDDGLNQLKILCFDLNKKPKYKNRKITEKDVNAIYHELFSRPRMKITPETFQQRNILEIFSETRLRNIFSDIIKEHQRVEMAGETDEPVTTDVKRLIRMPTSIHGKTGLRAVPLEIDELAAFEPLKDAVVFNSEPVKVNSNVNDQIKFSLAGEAFSVEPLGKGVELPEFAAVYLMCQRKAELS